MKKRLIAFACFLLVPLYCLPQLPVRLNERPVALNTSTGTSRVRLSGRIDDSWFRSYGYGREL